MASFEIQNLTQKLMDSVRPSPHMDHELYQAAESGNWEAIKQFSGDQYIQKTGLEDETQDEKTALLEAVRFDGFDVVKIFAEEMPEMFGEFVVSSFWFLMQIVIPVRIFEKNQRFVNESPLYMAVEKGHIDIVTMILSTVNSMAYQGPEGRTALHAAAARNSPECVEMVLERMPDLAKKVDVHGWTALHCAAKFSHRESVKLLLSIGKSVGYIVAKKDDSKTALHVAYLGLLNLKIERMFSGTTEKLEGYNLVNDPCVDTSAYNKKGLTPLDLVTGETRQCTSRQISIRDELVRANATSSLKRVFPEPDEAWSSREDKNAKTYLVVATLIVTVTFAAGVSVPGGYDVTKQNEGKAVLGKKASFIAFIVTDSMAMMLAIAAVVVQFEVKEEGHVSEKMKLLRWSKLNIAIAMTLMVMAFLGGLYAAIPLPGIKIYMIFFIFFKKLDGPMRDLPVITILILIP
ncbi:OLC1v1003064C1 [Oldenlandia corymbosa var. corymbosa]|uniref:OLC1v1003064C1 n=1 Tax=Oldenlandia corymbosa var. corymbosa TaxID=529605 RepID=A0AAV1DC41_OLDCO|nr:OLC1v1003064C1 [Oldenlandia corymbosa var. corymbosa]